MKLKLTYLLTVVLLALLVTACGEKEAPPPAPAPVVVPSAAPVAPVEAVQPTSGGGYEPTAEERIPGITLPADAVKAPAVESTPAETPATK